MEARAPMRIAVIAVETSSNSFIAETRAIELEPVAVVITISRAALRESITRGVSC